MDRHVGAAPARPASQARVIESRISASSAFADAGDRLGDESLQQHRFGFASRHAARLQIEHLLGIERADRRAVAADDVVGENFELRLVVHRRASARAGSPGDFMAPSVFCAPGLTMTLPWNTPIPSSATICLEEFPALALRRGVNDFERRVGMAAPVDQGEAAERDPRACSPARRAKICRRDERRRRRRSRRRRVRRRSARRATWLSTCRPAPSSIEATCAALASGARSIQVDDVALRASARRRRIAR